MPGFRDAARLWLVETSPALRAPPGRDARRRRARAGRPSVDAAPRRAAVRRWPTSSSTPCRSASSSAPTRSGASDWSALDGDRLAFALGRRRARTPSSTRRFPLLPRRRDRRGQPRRRRRSPRASAPASPRRGGAALLIDYGAWDGTGDTLQAAAPPRPGRSARRARAPPTSPPTSASGALAAAARPARAYGPVGQGAFLERLGITARARALARGRAGPERRRHRRRASPLDPPRRNGKPLPGSGAGAGGRADAARDLTDDASRS